MVDWPDSGWVRFPHDPAVTDWVLHALPAARHAMDTPGDPPRGFDCGGTWFVGVDALDNDSAGATNGSGPLRGLAMEFLRSLGPIPPLHRAQLSGIFPGYPKPKTGEGDAAFSYRLKRDAAHVDGLLPIGPNRQRMIREPHIWILGLPLTPCTPDSSPLVLWHGSHHIMRRAFQAALHPHPPENWPDIDLTAAYQAARREVFATCPRVKVVAQPGEAYVLHRHLLHGVAPWEGPDHLPGRLVAYFRPDCPGGVTEWLQA